MPGTRGFNGIVLSLRAAILFERERSVLSVPQFPRAVFGNPVVSYWFSVLSLAAESASYGKIICCFPGCRPKVFPFQINSPETFDGRLISALTPEFLET